MKDAQYQCSTLGLAWGLGSRICVLTHSEGCLVRPGRSGVVGGMGMDWELTMARIMWGTVGAGKAKLLSHYCPLLACIRSSQTVPKMSRPTDSCSKKMDLF